MAAVDDVEKGLRRRDAELAVAALLKVPEAERGPLLARVGELFAEAVARAHGRSEWSRCDFWAARADKEPRLAGEPGSDGALGVEWVLFWASLRAGALDRAARSLERLRPALKREAPRLFEAIASLFDSDATKIDALVAALALPEPDPRLGRDETPPPPPGPPPRAEPEVEAAVLSLGATRSWPRFAAAVADWVRQASPAVALAIGRLATSLALHEQLLRAEAKDASADEPALLAAELAELLSYPAHLDEELFASFRLVGARAAEEPFDTADAARPFCALAKALARYEASRTTVLHAVEGRLFTPNAARAGLETVKAVASQASSLALLAKGVRLAAWADPRRRGAPGWLVEAWRALLRGSPAVAPWLAGLPDKERAERLGDLSAALPLEDCEALAVLAWDGAEPRLRAELAAFVARLLHRELEGPGDGLFGEEDCGCGRGRDCGARQSSELMGLALGGGALSASGRAVLRRQEARLLGYSDAFLGFALDEATDEAEAGEKLRRHLATATSATAWAKAMACAGQTGWVELADRERDRFVTAHQGEVRALGEALDASLRLGAPEEFLRPLAGAFHAASTRVTAPLDAGLSRLLKLARRLLPKKGRGKRGAPGPKAKQSKAKNDKAPKKPGRGSSGPDDIPF